MGELVDAGDVDGDADADADAGADADADVEYADLWIMGIVNRLFGPSRGFA